MTDEQTLAQKLNDELAIAGASPFDTSVQFHSIKTAKLQQLLIQLQSVPYGMAAPIVQTLVEGVKPIPDPEGDDGGGEPAE